MPHRRQEDQELREVPDLRHHEWLRRRGRLLRRQIQHHQRLRRHAVRVHRSGRGHGADALRGRDQRRQRRRGHVAVLHGGLSVQEAVHAEPADAAGGVGSAPGHRHQLCGAGESLRAAEGEGRLPLQRAGGGHRGRRRGRGLPGSLWRGNRRVPLVRGVRGPKRQRVDGEGVRGAGHRDEVQPGGSGRAGGAARRDLCPHHRRAVREQDRVSHREVRG